MSEDNIATIENPKTSDTTLGWWQSLKNKVYDWYQGIMGNFKSPFAGLKSYFMQEQNQDAKSLNDMRENQFNNIKAQSNKPNPNYAKLTRDISADTKQFMRKVIDEEVQKLGAPPCEFSVVTLGSMAREESGPVTDLEIGFLLKEKSVENYK
ncbi:MAG: DUF294 nucleotidyltransferase-like domain-containing protein, partial [Candidatus Berkiella sp.]